MKIFKQIKILKKKKVRYTYFAMILMIKLVFSFNYKDRELI